MDLTIEPVRSKYANVSSLHETRDGHKFKLGPMEIFVYSAERAEDTSFQAAGTSMLRFAYGGVGTGVTAASTSALLADPSGADLLMIGFGAGAGVFLVGAVLNAYRIRRRKNH
jgi:hypothetical protein